MDVLSADKQSILDQLRHNFSSFEPGLREELATQSKVRTFSAGETLMKPGQYFKSSMLVTLGRVKVYKQGQDGGELFMYYIEPGQACALSMICAARQEQSELLAVAMEETGIIAVPVALMDELMMKYRSWNHFVLETYRNRFEELLSLVDHTVFKGLDERLEFYLVNQQKALHTDELRMTHEEIARDLGTSRVVISRLLKHMEQSGRIVLSRNAVNLKNLSV